MYVDPSGHFAISAFVASLLIGIGVGAAFGAGISGAVAYAEGERGWDLAWDIVGGAILGGALGAASVLGGAAGLASVGMTVGGYGLSLTAAGMISVGTVAAASMASYSLDCAASEKKWNQKDFFIAGAEGALDGLINFGVGFIGGRIGLFNGMDKIVSHSYYQQVGMNGLRFGVFTSQALIGEVATKFAFVTIPSFILRLMFNV